MKKLQPVFTLACCLLPAVGWGQSVDFNREVRPILSDKCYHCHGPDTENRKANLRLDTPEGAQRVVKGESAELTKLYRRITHADAEKRMPPADANFSKVLTPKEIDTLKRWLSSGAKYARHWAFEKPVQVKLPDVADPDWQRPIDRFIAARLKKEGLSPNPRADRATLLRRVTLDLTGLPPTPAEVEAFLKDKSADAYEKVVDRLLQSPRYGERMTLFWMDLARYGDSSVYHADGNRDMWGWRDEVIRSFNTNQPFDQFTIEQLAGDLIPNATLAQKVASGFNRNNATTDEGGVIPEEFRVDYVVDRVKTVSNTWLAMSLECSQCHDHKYDPVSQREYYQFYAFFNSTKDGGMQTRKGNAAPVVNLPDLNAPPGAKAGTASVMVMEDLPKMRPTYILNRGQYDQPLKDKQVQPGVPAILPPLPKDAPVNRLGLARWLVQPDHPLTGRVAVNRFWQLLFGEGLVRTSEDFGLQGEMPSHAELLDWLAVDFAKNGWDVKRALKQIVMSSTYCQESRLTPKVREADPQNRLLAHAPRLRLQAEFIRDNFLFVSGLMVEKIGGKSVKPYQPRGLWTELSMGGPDWIADKGEKLYRRSMYTYWKRSVPHPAMLTFDAPTREKCTGHRPRTNTPLQALVTLNDPQFVEAARAFGQRILKVGGTSTRERIQFAYMHALGRPAAENELGLIERLLASQRTRFAADPKKAEALVKVGDSPRDTSIPAVEHASWTVIASTIMNLDEFLVKN